MSEPILETKRPLCVDLDGTLIATDALWESFLLLAKAEPTSVLRVPFWLGKGRARLKRELAQRVLPDPAALPYRSEVLAYIQQAKASGRPIYLVTASDQNIADAVGQHLGLFDGVIGSDGARNLKGEEKAKLLEEQFGVRGFDYVGDSNADLPLWKASHRAVVVDAKPSTLARAKASTPTAEVLPVGGRSRLRALVKALRPHQWAKNVLLFVAPILAHLREPKAFLQVLAAFMAFSLVASSVYVLNDLLDLEQDRLHRSKRNRPFASGALSIPVGLVLAPLTMLLGLALSFLVRVEFSFALIGYLVLTTAYSVTLKRKLIVDVLTLGGLFTYRVLAGGLAVGVMVSFWLLAFSMFFFTGLAFVKRYSEILQTQAKALDKVPGRNYQISDLDIIRSVGPASGLMAVLVFAFYIHSPEVQQLYTRPDALWLICPVLMYWITRVWFLAARDQLNDDPVIFALRDKVSYLAGGVSAACIVLAL